ncbi:hypothetical protein DUI87_10346 [Hirundo rustica rustica]|uniref:Uncharacterized protein n=1 Tax=Hirundo rustica rustica TaxID=333673 RepID=A0A3M0KJK6_HIRRU|nr:hypothetical protein DUI87_10346 [Hirundo rustica rustica]
MDSGTESTLSKSANNTKLYGVSCMLEGKDATQRNLNRLEEWACASFIKFNKTKGKVPHLDRGNPKHKCRLSREWIESSPCEDLDLLVAEKLDMSGLYKLAAKVINHVLGCIKSSVASRAREVLLPPQSALMRPHLKVLRPVLGPQHEKDMDVLKQVHRKDMEMLTGLEHLSSEDRLRDLGLS